MSTSTATPGAAKPTAPKEGAAVRRQHQRLGEVRAHGVVREAAEHEGRHARPGRQRGRRHLGARADLVRVEITPGERFVHLIETTFGLARERHVNAKGMLSPLQPALTAQEFSDVIVFRKPPPRVQRVVFAALAPIARRRGYRATYPSLSRTTLAPRSPHTASS
jgi:hypothetical protein